MVHGTLDLLRLPKLGLPDQSLVPPPPRRTSLEVVTKVQWVLLTRKCAYDCRIRMDKE